MSIQLEDLEVKELLKQLIALTKIMILHLEAINNDTHYTEEDVN